MSTPPNYDYTVTARIIVTASRPAVAELEVRALLGDLTADGVIRGAIVQDVELTEEVDRLWVSEQQ